MIARRTYEPKPWQPGMTDHTIEHKRCAIWADGGMGKGVTTLTALSILDMIVDDVFPALVIGPKRVAEGVWPVETDKWEHLKHLACVSLVGDPEHRRRAIKFDSPIYSINYEQLPWLVEYWGDRWPYKTVIADESTKLKSYRGSYRTSTKGKVFLHSDGGARAKALGKVAHEYAHRFIELTGTPAPNGLKDLWGQAWFLDRGERLGRTFEGFKQRWFKPSYDGFGIIPLEGAEAEIHARIRDLCLTIDAADWLDLEQPFINDIYVDLPPTARKAYVEMEKHMFTELLEGSTVEAFGAAARTLKCLQLANGAVYTDPTTESDQDPKAKQWKAVHDVKMDALDSIIEESNGANMMIAYTFRSDLTRIMKAYPQAVDLSTAAGLKAFKADQAQLGLCHPDSLGHGVDGLQEVCHEITHFGHGWPLDTYDQLNWRIGPIRQMQSGFKRIVRINRIIARDTLDEDVIARRVSKGTVQDALRNAAKRRRK